MAYRASLIPAYGRKYKSEKDVLLDWESGKDFKLMNGPYCSIRDLEQLKKDFDIIEILWMKRNILPKVVEIYRHPLTGLSSYVENYPKKPS